MARKSENIQVRVTASMLERIDAIPALTRTEAVRALIEKGLATADKPAKPHASPVFDFVKAQRAATPPAGDDAPSTYSSIAQQLQQQDREARSLKPGLEQERVYTAGAIPPSPGNVWNSVDRGVVDKAPRGPWTGSKLAPE